MLTGSQQKELHNALMSAFPNRIALEKMLLFELDKQLEEIVGSTNLSDSVFMLIKTAISQGWLEDLVLAAHDSNPGNQLLFSFLKQHYLKSDRNVDYRRLRDLLKSQQWKEADEETLRVMLLVAGREKECWFFPKDIYDFPCKDLYTIDWLWGKYSNGRFGFSAQKLIYKRLYGITDWDFKLMVEYREFKLMVKYRDRSIFAFYEAVGWSEKSYNELTFNLQAPVGHLPRLGGSSVGDLTDEDYFEESGMAIASESGPRLWEVIFFRIETCNFSNSYL